jgi:hypothetical protein
MNEITEYEGFKVGDTVLSSRGNVEIISEIYFRPVPDEYGGSRFPDDIIVKYKDSYDYDFIEN